MGMTSRPRRDGLIVSLDTVLGAEISTLPASERFGIIGRGVADRSAGG
jgi:hypothetical protein